MPINSIVHRLDIMKAHWEKAASQSGVYVIRWFVKPDEVSMVDAFYEMEANSRL